MITRFAFVLAAAAFAACQTQAADPGLEERVKKLEDEVKSLKADLNTLKANPAARAGADAPPAEVTVSLGDHPQGDLSAPVGLVEFSDFQCPFCGRWYDDSLTKLRDEYIDKGKLVFTYRQYPLPFHGQAQKAAEAALCAADQKKGKFWDMHDAIFANRKDMDVPALKQNAEKIGLKASKFEACLKDGTFASAVQQDLAEGQKVGIRGTPGFVVGKFDRDKKTVTGKVISGALPYAQFKSEIDSLLSAAD